MSTLCQMSCLIVDYDWRNSWLLRYISFMFGWSWTESSVFGSQVLGQAPMHKGNATIINWNQDLVENLDKHTTFTISRSHVCHNIVLKSFKILHSKKKLLRRFFHIFPTFPQDHGFTKFLILLVVLGHIFLEEIIRNSFNQF